MRWFVGYVKSEKGMKFEYDVIAWFFGAPYVHIFMVFSEGSLEDGIVYETTPTVTSKRTYKERADVPLEVYEVLEGNPEAAREWCEKNLNIKYDYVGIVGMGAILLLEKFINMWTWPLRKLKWVKWWKFGWIYNIFHSKKKFYCSEYVEGSLEAGGLKGDQIWEDGNLRAPDQRDHMIAHPEMYSRIV